MQMSHFFGKPVVFLRWICNRLEDNVMVRANLVRSAEYV